MIAPQSMQDGASPWVAKATFTFPSDIVIPPPFPLALAAPFPFVTCPLACPLVAMTLSSEPPFASAVTSLVATAVALGSSPDVASRPEGDADCGSVAGEPAAAGGSAVR